MPLQHMVTSLAEVWIEIVSLTGILTFPAVTSLAEVWIEICPSPSGSLSLSVTSLAEVWIEICRYLFLIIPHLSLPLRKCGLK